MGRRNALSTRDKDWSAIAAEVEAIYRAIARRRTA
jgi:hypothetical protein